VYGTEGLHSLMAVSQPTYSNGFGPEDNIQKLNKDLQVFHEDLGTMARQLKESKLKIY